MKIIPRPIRSLVNDNPSVRFFTEAIRVPLGQYLFAKADHLRYIVRAQKTPGGASTPRVQALPAALAFELQGGDKPALVLRQREATICIALHGVRTLTGALTAYPEIV